MPLKRLIVAGEIHGKLDQLKPTAKNGSNYRIAAPVILDTEFGEIPFIQGD